LRFGEILLRALHRRRPIDLETRPNDAFTVDRHRVISRHSYEASERYRAERIRSLFALPPAQRTTETERELKNANAEELGD
jgi:hypothetical protein